MPVFNGTDGPDTLNGGSGADTLNGLGGNDSLSGLAGNDVLNGDDSVSALFGNDTLIGGLGSDTIYGGKGDDVIYNGDAGAAVVDSSADSVYAGDGNDQIHITEIGSGSALYDGGAGVDTIYFEYDPATLGGTTLRINMANSGDTQPLDSIPGDQFFRNIENVVTGSGNDSVIGNNADNAITTAGGNDILGGGGGNDSLYAGIGNDNLDGGANNDLLVGDAGTDNLVGGSGGDLLYGGADNDTLNGGSNNDTLQGGAGSDLLTGGTGDDRFLADADLGRDTITDFDLTIYGGTGLTHDQLSVSALTDANGDPVKVYDVVVGNDGSGNALLTFPNGETIVLSGISPAAVTPTVLHAMGVPCFVSGTMIRTPEGDRAVETLGVGDVVMTTEGAVPLLWHGKRHLDAADLDSRPDLRPVSIAAGAIGNRRELRLSPQHAVLVAGADGAQLIRARHLAEAGGPVRVARGTRQVTYHHLLLPAHSLIWAEGAVVESFYPGPMAVAALQPADREALAEAILALDPLATAGALDERYGPRCQPLLSRPQAANWLVSVGWRSGKGKADAGVADSPAPAEVFA